MMTSRPIGYAGCFQPALPEAENVRFIAHVYGQDHQELCDYVEDFAHLGSHFHQPVYAVSAGMNARLAAGVSPAINFECYHLDEVTGAGDKCFRQRCGNAPMKRRASGSLVMISHGPNALQQYCDKGAVLYGGSLTFSDTVAEASGIHHRL